MDDAGIKELARSAKAVPVENPEPQPEFDCDWNDMPRCPYCGEYDYDWWEDSALHEDGGRSECWCGACSKTFVVVAYHSVNFSSEKQKEIDAETKETS